jgi:hypothetical protein
MLVPLADMANHLLPPTAAYALDAQRGVFELAARRVRCRRACFCLFVLSRGVATTRSSGVPRRRRRRRQPHSACSRATAYLTLSPSFWQDLAPGEQVCISYLGQGKSATGVARDKSNAELLRDYGFTIPGNRADRIALIAGACVRVFVGGWVRRGKSGRPPKMHTLTL